jgi:hypothetical protein
MANVNTPQMSESDEKYQCTENHKKTIHINITATTEAQELNSPLTRATNPM